MYINKKKHEIYTNLYIKKLTTLIIQQAGKLLDLRINHFFVIIKISLIFFDLLFSDSLNELQRALKNKTKKKKSNPIVTKI